MPDQASKSSSQQSPTLPPRPQCRPGSSRTGTACFWTLFLLFLSGIVYLGVLAYSRNAGQAEPDPGTGGHLAFGLALVTLAVAAVIGVIASHHHGKQRH